MAERQGSETSNDSTFNQMNYRANQAPNWRVALLLGISTDNDLYIWNLNYTEYYYQSSKARPSFAFIPPLLAYTKLSQCEAKLTDVVPEEEYLNRIQIVSGSLLVASICLTLIGATGLISVISKRVGPLTIAPLMILLCVGNVPLIIEKAGLHWLSLVQFFVLLLFAFFLVDTPVKLPYVNLQGIHFVEYRLFGNFPYLLSIMISWLCAVLLTVTNLTPEGSAARVDRNESIEVLTSSPWFQVPYPCQFGWPQINLGLLLGFLTSCLACSTESLGAYCTLAKVSYEKKPPSRTLNRAILVEGFGCCLSSLFGCGVGITTYSENVAVVSITKVASRFVMQIAGIMLILLGLFTKFAAVLATCPDPLIGGMLAMSVALVCSVGFTNLQSVDLKISRNLSILGLGVILGIAIPEYVEKTHIDVGVNSLNEMLNIMLTTRMFVGAAIAFVLDNISRGATPEQRGLHIESNGDDSTNKYDGCGSEHDGYSFSDRINRILLKLPHVHRLPFMPSKQRLEATVSSASHIMVSLGGMLVVPYLVSDFVCATGEAKVELRARLISSTVIVAGLTTLLQTTFGLRLSILQGPAFAFIPPLLAFSRLPEMRCDSGNSEIDYIQKLQIISGSVAGAGIAQLLLGATGLIGLFQNPLMVLLCVGNCTIVLEKAALHWISLIQFALLFSFIYFMSEIEVPLPLIQNKKVKIGRVKLFGRLPYLLGIAITWFLAFLLTRYDAIPEGNPARVDNPNSLNTIRNMPYFSLPYPTQFGFPQFSLGLFLGCLTSALAASVESLGIGCVTFGLFGCGVGATAYSENIAIVSIVRNASRRILQFAGVMFIVVGLFTKFGAALAAIPDPIIGGVFGVSVCLVCGICLSNLQPVDLSNSKILTTLGTAIILGIIIPNYVETYPIATGINILDQSLNMLLSIKMFVGGLIGFVLDNVSGQPQIEESSNKTIEERENNQIDGYSFPLSVNRWLVTKTKLTRFLPFLPAKDELLASIRLQESCVNKPENEQEMHTLISQTV
ncbi:Xanthine/uracil/vitamin C permease family-containing protein [Aphelenchoides bicaudatus]|nr:Xanthine/uracil/vitamin C permease family-containing protein [Aphelenchoides bicaudatus]